MDRRNKRLTGLIIVAALVAALIANMRFIETRYLADTETAPVVSTEDIPPTLALTTFALGPLRGLIVDGLWWRMIQHQDRGNYFETIQLTNWITALQPRFANVWAFGAWNLCYNVASEFPDPEQRWKWIERAISMLRDQGRLYNPDHPVIRRELARIFWDRIGKRGDVSQTLFQRSWAMKIIPFLSNGSREDIEALIAEDGERAEAFRTELGLDLKRMLFIDQEYGPFDWRLPQAHAVYWGVPSRMRFNELFSAEERQVENLVRQSLEQAFRHGRLIYNPDSGFFMTTNNLDVLGKVHDYYDRMLEEHYTKSYDELHKRFLEEAVAVLYSYNAISAAREMYGHFREDYFSETYHPSFEEFCIDAVQHILLGTSYADSRAMVHAVFYQAYFALASGDVQRARGYARMARLIYDRHQKKYAKASSFLLPPIDDIKKGAVAEVRGSDIADFMKERLSEKGIDPEKLHVDEMQVYTGALGSEGHGLREKHQGDKKGND